MLGYPVATVEDIWHHPQLDARCPWQDVADPASGATLKYPGGFAVVDGKRLPIRRPPPIIGQHKREIYEDELSATGIAAAQAAGTI